MSFSLGGLSFEYVAMDSARGGNATVEVFLLDGSLHIHSLRCVVAYDVESRRSTEDSQLEAAYTFTTRSCGVRFLLLSERQKSQIKNFILEHTRGSVS